MIDTRELRWMANTAGGEALNLLRKTVTAKAYYAAWKHRPNIRHVDVQSQPAVRTQRLTREQLRYFRPLKRAGDMDAVRARANAVADIILGQTLPGVDWPVRGVFWLVYQLLDDAHDES